MGFLLGILLMSLTPTASASDCAAVIEHMRNQSWAIRGWPAPFKVSFRTWEPPEMTVAQARENLRAIHGLPDHPDRERLERALSAALAEGWSEPETIWYFGDKRLRYHTVDTLSKAGHVSRVDLGVDGDAYWSMGNNSLSLVQAGTAPDNMNQRRAIHRMLESGLGVAAAPGLYAHLKDVRLEACQSDARDWSATWTRENGRTRLRTTGIVAPDGELLTTEVRALRVNGESPAGSGGVGFSRHEYSEVFARSVPRLVRFGPESSPRRMYEILEIARVDPTQADALVRRPEHGATDPLRGRIAFEHLTDWRSGSPQVQTWTATTGWTVPDNAPQLNRDSRKRMRRTVAISFTACAIVGALVVVRLLRQGNR